MLTIRFYNTKRITFFFEKRLLKNVNNKIKYSFLSLKYKLYTDLNLIEYFVFIYFFNFHGNYYYSLGDVHR